MLLHLGWRDDDLDEVLTKGPSADADLFELRDRALESLLRGLDMNMAVGLGFAGMEPGEVLPCPAPQAGRLPPTMARSMSIGMGKRMVEFCSIPISVRVWR